MIESVNLNNIQKIKATLLDNPELSLCIASKYASTTQISKLYESGFRVFGENKIQDGIKKISALSHLSDIKWHFIGHLQSNKVQKAIENFDVIQSIDSLKLLEKIDLVSKRLDKVSVGYIQVNSGNDPKKFGFSLENIYKIKKEIFSFSNVKIQGIMIVAPNTDNNIDLENIFKDSFKLYSDLCDEFKLDQLSMGMSQDYKLAVKSGSTMIRIGRMLFT